MLRPERTLHFKRDYKRLQKKHFNLDLLDEVLFLIVQNTFESRAELRRHHNMHRLSGDWSGSDECHVANAGDWFVVWRTEGDAAIFQRTGSHDEIFG